MRHTFSTLQCSNVIFACRRHMSVNTFGNDETRQALESQHFRHGKEMISQNSLPINHEYLLFERTKGERGKAKQFTRRG